MRDSFPRLKLIQPTSTLLVALRTKLLYATRVLLLLSPGNVRRTILTNFFLNFWYELLLLIKISFFLAHANNHWLMLFNNIQGWYYGLRLNSNNSNSETELSPQPTPVQPGESLVRALDFCTNSKWDYRLQQTLWAGHWLHKSSRFVGHLHIFAWFCQNSCIPI